MSQDIDISAAAAANYRAEQARMTEGPLDPAAIAEALTPPDPATMEVQTPAAAPAKPLTLEQQARKVMADAMVEFGHMTREQADQAAALEDLRDQYGADVITETPPRVEEPLRDINKLEQWEDRPEHPQRYNLAPTLEMTTQDLADVQSVFFDGHIPAPIAQTIWPEIEKLVASPVSDADLELLNRSTMSAARSRWGADTDTMLGYGQRLIRDLSAKHPKLLETLELTGAGSNQTVVFHCCEHAARLYKKGA